MSVESLRCLLSGEARTRIAIVAAHPDDEVIGAGAQLARWRDAHVIYVTDGAPVRTPADARNAGFASLHAYAAARRREAETALGLAGIAPDRARFLELPDQAVAFRLLTLTTLLAGELGRIEPDIVITHPYEGGHPDHDSTAFAVRAACRRLQAREHFAPAIIEMTSYHDHAGALETGCFLESDPGGVLVMSMGRQERAAKRRLLACYATQRNVLRYFPVQPEQFRQAPDYDFTCPPHPGLLYYERFKWGVSGQNWRRLAAQALHELYADPYVQQRLAAVQQLSNRTPRSRPENGMMG